MAPADAQNTAREICDRSCEKREARERQQADEPRERADQRKPALRV
jgi:hypothetical protein